MSILSTCFGCKTHHCPPLSVSCDESSQLPLRGTSPEQHITKNRYYNRLFLLCFFARSLPHQWREGRLDDGGCSATHARGRLRQALTLSQAHASPGAGTEEHSLCFCQPRPLPFRSSPILIPTAIRALARACCNHSTKRARQNSAACQLTVISSSHAAATRPRSAPHCARTGRPEQTRSESARRSQAQQPPSPALQRRSRQLPPSHQPPPSFSILLPRRSTVFSPAV